MLQLLYNCSLTSWPPWKHCHYYPEEGGSEDTANGTTTANETSSDRPTTASAKAKKDKAGKKEKQQPEVKESTVKVNLTADVTVLDLPLPTEASTTVSTNKWVMWLQLHRRVFKE